VTDYCYGGVDPGLSGAVAFFFPNRGALAIFDMPVAAGEVSASALSLIVKPYRSETAMTYIERVHSMPRQGVSSTFKFGVGYGEVLGVFAALDFSISRIDPSVWKRAVGLPAGAPKELSVRRALEVFPHHADLFTRPNLKKKGALVLLDGRAEAALLAWHCYTKNDVTKLL
jgi:crossover junction endodeoxyribonuclease RuvC